MSKIPSVLFWIKFCSFMTKSQRNVLTFFFYIYYLLIWGKKNRFIEIIEIFKLLPISFPTCQLSKPHVSPSSSCLDSGFPSAPKTCTNTNTSSSTANFRASIVASGQSGSEGFELLVMKTRTKSKWVLRRFIPGPRFLFTLFKASSLPPSLPSLTHLTWPQSHASPSLLCPAYGIKMNKSPSPEFCLFLSCLSQIYCYSKNPPSLESKIWSGTRRELT